jgi:hypothetical protein
MRFSLGSLFRFRSFRFLRLSRRYQDWHDYRKRTDQLTAIFQQRRGLSQAEARTLVLGGSVPLHPLFSTHKHPR